MQMKALGDSLSLLRTRRFGTFWFASLLSNIGTWAQQVAQPWLMLSLGASSFLIGLDAFALGAPVWLLTLWGGMLADRADRRRVISQCQSLQMLCPTMLVVLLLAGAVHPWMVISLSLVVGVTDALSMPSFQSIVPSIVERSQIPAGLALNSTQFNLSRILGPALAGVLIAGVGAIACFALSAASYVPFIAVALWILPRRTAAPAAGDAMDWRHPFSGIREIVREPQLRGALLTVLATSTLCGPLITFCPVIVRDSLHGDASHFSFAIGAFGIGGLLGALGLLGAAPERDLRRSSTWFALAYGAVVVLVALSPWLWVLPALLLLAGLSMNVSNTSANSVLQTAANPRLRGRTVSLYMLAMRGGLSIGSLATGAAVTYLGVRYALLLDGAAALLIHSMVGWDWRKSARARRIAA
jgi:predicted MFS family arabinose efflux permease